MIRARVGRLRDDGKMLSDAVHAELDAAGSSPITVDITTTGRRSGHPRRVEIWMVNVEGRVMIGGTPGRRDWLSNLRARPDLTVHFKETTTADLAARATEVIDAATRRTVWNHRSTSWYRQQCPVDDLVADAPLVEITWT